MFKFTALLFLTLGLYAADKPNFLIITADDMNYDSVGCYGSLVRQTTPNIDKLAGMGLRFEHAHVASTACYPSRNAIQTGRYPHTSGGEGFHYLRFKNIPTIVNTLTKNNYHVGILGKVQHSTPYEDTPWDYAEELHRKTGEFYSKSAQFIESAKAKDQPFYLIVNSHDPHRPYFDINKPEKGADKNSKPSKIFSPEEIVVPPFVPDTKEVRTELACYYSSVRRFDDVVGKMIDLLSDQKVVQNTIVILLSDHGMGLPSAKANVYLNSTKTPFIIIWPGKTKAGSIDNKNMISTIDIFPTLLDAAGITKPEGIDGQSLLPLIEGKEQQGRDILQTQFYSTSGHNHYQMRTVQNHKYLYIFNAWHNGDPVYSSSSLGGESFKSMLKMGTDNKQWSDRAQHLLVRTPEEFYDLENDPHCMNNLLNSSAHKSDISRMKATMRQRMKLTKDYLLPVFEEWQNTNDVLSMHQSFLEVISAVGVKGKAPVRAVDMARWSDPDYKKKKRQETTKTSITDEQRKERRLERRKKSQK